MTLSVPRAYCWDACIFIQHFKTSEPATATQRQAIRRLLALNEKQQNVVFTSSVTHLEVLPKKITRDDDVAEQKYWNMFRSKYFYEVPIDAQVIKLAREIKDFYFRESDAKAQIPYRMMDTGDAIHLATAIVNGADERWMAWSRQRFGFYKCSVCRLVG